MISLGLLEASMHEADASRRKGTGTVDREQQLAARLLELLECAALKCGWRERRDAARWDEPNPASLASGYHRARDSSRKCGSRSVRSS